VYRRFRRQRERKEAQLRVTWLCLVDRGAVSAGRWWELRWCTNSTLHCRRWRTPSPSSVSLSSWLADWVRPPPESAAGCPADGRRSPPPPRPAGTASERWLTLLSTAAGEDRGWRSRCRRRTTRRRTATGSCRRRPDSSDWATPVLSGPPAPAFYSSAQTAVTTTIRLRSDRRSTPIRPQFDCATTIRRPALGPWAYLLWAAPLHCGQNKGNRSAWLLQDGYVTVIIMTIDKQWNGRRIEVKS